MLEPQEPLPKWAQNIMILTVILFGVVILLGTAIWWFKWVTGW